MKIKTFLFLFFGSFSVLYGEGLVLKPLNPFSLRDDAFNIKVDVDLSKPIQAESWVKFQSEDWLKMPIKNWYVSDSGNKSHETELRLFLVKDEASYEEIRESIRSLLAMGYRPTTLFHLVAFSSTQNARNLNPGVFVIVSERPVIRLDNKNTVSLKAFYGALAKGNELVVGVALPEDVKLIPTRILILEPPVSNL